MAILHAKPSDAVRRQDSRSESHPFSKRESPEDLVQGGLLSLAYAVPTCDRIAIPQSSSRASLVGEDRQFLDVIAPLLSIHGEEASVKRSLPDGALVGAWTSMKSVKRRTALASHRRKAAGAVPKRTSMARSAQTMLMLRPPIPMPGSTATARRRSCASLGTG